MRTQKVESKASPRSETGTLARGLMLLASLVAVCAATAGDISSSGSDETQVIIRVEEDWEMVLNEPNESTTSPQFCTLMSPVGNASGAFAQVIWNYRETDEGISEGGLQLQAFSGDTTVRRRTVGELSLSTMAETVTWTQMLELEGSILSYEIKNGHSATWGEFGRDMRLSSAWTHDNLSSYRTDVSVANSCVTYGTNRVETMKIKEVRYYTVDGLVYTDRNERVVFERED